MDEEKERLPEHLYKDNEYSPELIEKARDALLAFNKHIFSSKKNILKERMHFEMRGEGSRCVVLSYHLKVREPNGRTSDLALPDILFYGLDESQFIYANKLSRIP